MLPPPVLLRTVAELTCMRTHATGKHARVHLKFANQNAWPCLEHAHRTQACEQCGWNFAHYKSHELAPHKLIPLPLGCLLYIVNNLPDNKYHVDARLLRLPLRPGGGTAELDAAFDRCTLPAHRMAQRPGSEAYRTCCSQALHHNHRVQET